MTDVLIDITMPLHVIPLVIGSAFLLVTEFSTHVVKASDILSGSASFARIAFPPAPPNGQRRGLSKMRIYFWAYLTGYQEVS